jgi:hypothetical protein
LAGKTFRASVPFFVLITRPTWHDPMHVRELAEVAGLVALNAPQFVAIEPPASCAHLEQYWATTKTRFDGWARALKCASTLGENDSSPQDEWLDIRASLDEIFIGELLARIWAAVVVARDLRWSSDGASSIARSVLAAHMEARRRALALLLNGSLMTAQDTIAIDRVRRRAERWTDALLGGIAHLGDVREFAVDFERVEDFSTDLTARSSRCGAQQFWRLLLVSLHSAFRRGVSPAAASAEANARIAASILGCFRAELFDSTGVFQSLWMTRLSATASDVQGMIGDLLSPGQSIGLSRPRIGRGRRRG